jgi:CRISPR-associated protein Csx17
MAYLKALGVLRVISEQVDSAARGWWQSDTFWLRSPGVFADVSTEEAKRETLARFFLEKYRPTPIVAPWAGGSGFFKKDNKMAVTALGKSNSLRVRQYRDVIEMLQAILAEEEVDDKPKDAEKNRLIRRYRRELPDGVVAWMDAAMVVEDRGQSFAPVLGTGGNDGHLDFTRNFMQRLIALALHKDSAASDQSRCWLEHSLFGRPTTLDEASVGQFAPGRVGGPNATQGMEGNPADNPWDFVLMLEGALLLAGAATKRLNAAELGRAAFPFTVRTVAAGFDSPATKDWAGSRGELWLPMWTRSATLGEIGQLFGEGRADVSGRPARDGIDFARAVATLGVDRGVAEFTRLGFLKRSGKAYLAAPLGRFEVRERREADLLREIDPWLDRFRRAVRDSGGQRRDSEPVPRFASALRAIDSAIFDFCRYGGTRLFQRVLIALGRAERELAVTPGRVGQSKWPPEPFAGLSWKWIKAADDRSLEFAIARALAGIYDPECKIGPLRANLEPVGWKKRFGAWAEKDRVVAWSAASLPFNLQAVLERRMMDGERQGCEDLPLASHARASLSATAKFIERETDDLRVEDLLWGLVLVERRSYDPPESDDIHGIPVAYALLKLLFLPRPLVIERRQDGRVSARYAKPAESGIRVRPEPRILRLLGGGRLGEACVIAMRRLRASGLGPMPQAQAGRTRDRDWGELDRMGTAGLDSARVAAALLLPIGDWAVSRLVARVTQPEHIETESEADRTQ